MSAIAAPYGLRPQGLLSGRNFGGAFRQIQITPGTAITGGLGFGDPVKLSAGTIIKDTGTATMTPVGIFMGVTYTDPNTLQLTYKSFYPAAGISAVSGYLFAYIQDDPDVVFQAQADGTLTYAAIGRNVSLNSTFTVTATEVSTSPVLTVTASGNSYTVFTQGIFPGMALSGTGIAAGSFVVSVTATTITMNQNATANASNTVTVQGMNTIGNSMVSLNAASIATTNTLPIRILDFIQGPTSSPPTFSSAGSAVAGDAFTDCLCIWNWGMHKYRNATGT